MTSQPSTPSGSAQTYRSRVLRKLELECQTREEADELADFVSMLLPEPAQSRLGLMELLLNAIEHGNLEIGNALKGQLLGEHRFEDEINHRLQREPYCARRVRVKVTLGEQIEIEIRDEGPGFAWRGALTTGLLENSAPNGRGIALVSQTCFPSLTYKEPGNVAIVTLAWPS